MESSWPCTAALEKLKSCDIKMLIIDLLCASQANREAKHDLEGKFYSFHTSKKSVFYYYLSEGFKARFGMFWVLKISVEITT